MKRAIEPVSIEISNKLKNTFSSKLLILEDDSLAQLTIRKILEDIGYSDFTILGNIESAIDEINLNKYDLALCDVYIKGEAISKEFIDLLKTENQTKIILQTGLSSEDIKNMIDLDKVDFVIHKPYDYNEVADTIHKLLNP